MATAVHGGVATATALDLALQPRQEIGWTGFLQARLQDRYGPLKASVIVTVPFALWHLPDVMVDTGLGLAQLPLALGLLGILAISQMFGRVVIMWLYNNTISTDETDLTPL